MAQFEWLAETPGDFLDPPGGWIETRYGAKSRREGRRPYYLRYRRHLTRNGRMEIDRRTMLGAAALPLRRARHRRARQPTDDWERIAREYDVTREVIQLEHGNWGMMARPVLAAYGRKVERVNRDTSYYARRTMVGDLEAVRATLAGAMGVGVDEITFTRNATEAMKVLILQYNRLKPGDAVLYADLDYDSMQASMDSLAARRGVKVIKIALPEPATRASLIDAYRAAFDANPAIRMVLLTHLSHRTGLVLPVAEIASLARERGDRCSGRFGPQRRPARLPPARPQGGLHRHQPAQMDRRALGRRRALYPPRADRGDRSRSRRKAVMRPTSSRGSIPARRIMRRS